MVRQEQRSVIYFVLVNKKCYTSFQSLHIDKGWKMFDISDHNAVTAVFRIQAEGKQFKKGKDIQRTYFKTNIELLEQLAAQMQCRLIEKKVTKFEELNAMMREVAETVLKAIYRRRTSDKHHIKEQL